MTVGSIELPAIPNCHGSGTTYFRSVYWSVTRGQIGRKIQKWTQNKWQKVSPYLNKVLSYVKIFCTQKRLWWQWRSITWLQCRCQQWGRMWFSDCHWVKVKVKQSHNRPGVAQRVLGGLGCQIFVTFGTWRWWGCQPHTLAAFTPSKCFWYSYSLGAKSTPGPRNGQKEYGS